MATALNRAETRTISIAAAPVEVLAIVGDGHNLPRWAPAFAPSVCRDGSNWVIGTGEQRIRIRLHVSPEQGTVDILGADQPTRGAFLRVIPNGDGSEVLFTLFFPSDAGERLVADQMATVESELAAIRALAEPAPAG